MTLFKNKYLFPLLLLNIFFSCKNDKNKLIKEINAYHKNIANDTKDDESKKKIKYIYKLKEYQNLIENNQAIPDSIKAENNYLIGSYFFENDKKDSASVYLHKATTFIDSLSFSKKHTGYFHSLWDCYNLQGKYGDCISTSKRFKSFVNLNQDFENAALYYYFNEEYYIAIEDYQKSLTFNQKRIAVLEGKNNIKKSRALISQATLKYYYLNDRIEAIQILDTLIKKSKQFSNDFNRELYINYGIFLFYENRMSEALEYYLKGLDFTKKISDPKVLKFKKPYLGTSYINIAEAFMELKQYDTAQVYLDSIKTVGYGNIASYTQKNTLKYQIKLDILSGKQDSILKDIDVFYGYLDSEYKKKYEKDLDDLDVAYENGKKLLEENKAAEVRNLKLKSQYLIIVLGLIILILIGVILFNRNRFRHKKEKLYINQQLFRSQMNPHFTFNALYVIQNHIKKDPAIATKYLMKFSRLLRLTLENSLSSYVALDNELESLKKYMELQSLRFPDKFEYDISLEGIADPEAMYIPPMLMQPFVENSINHGFSGIKYKGKIKISLTKYSDKYVQCTIEDNGKGMHTKGNEHKKSASTILISNFIKRTTKTEVEITDFNQLKNEETGIKVQFLIPYKLESYD